MPLSPVNTLVKKIEADILSGKLPPGKALLTHRQLATKHGVAVATASKVYSQLRKMGLVVGETGRGTFVRDRPTKTDWDSGDEARRNNSSIELSFNHPTWPGQSELLRLMLRELAASGDLSSLLCQQSPGGRYHERKIVADYLLKERGIEVNEKNITFVNGVQQGLDITIRTLLNPHDEVAVDSLTYPGFKMIAEMQKLNIKPVSASINGPDLSELETMCSEGCIRALYTMPTIHNPLGWVLNLKQRKDIVRLARQYDFWIIEDAAYAWLVGNKAPQSFATLAPERTVYISSLSKSFSSGLRFGYIVYPEGCKNRFKATVRASFWSMPNLVTSLATRGLSDGTISRNEKILRKDAEARQLIARDIFKDMNVTAHSSSLFIWLKLPEDLRMDRIAVALADKGIAVSKAEAYSTTKHAPHALRLALSTVPIEKLKPVLLEVRETINSFPN